MAVPTAPDWLTWSCCCDGRTAGTAATIAALAVCNGGHCVSAGDEPCEIPRHVDCGSHGSCSGGTCACRDSFSGNRCEHDPCEFRVPDCGSHGSCSGGKCVCKQFWSGTMCTVADTCDVPVHVDCGSHGSCSGGKCTCTGGYTGAHCICGSACQKQALLAFKVCTTHRLYGALMSLQWLR